MINNSAARTGCRSHLELREEVAGLVEPVLFAPLRSAHCRQQPRVRPPQLHGRLGGQVSLLDKLAEGVGNEAVGAEKAAGMEAIDTG